MDEYASLRKIEFELCGGNLPEKYKAFVRRVLNDRNLIPAADVAPVVHGRWISWEEAGNCVPSPDRHECSVCHDAAQVLVNGFELLSDYCPNCGAKMDGGNENV